MSLRVRERWGGGQRLKERAATGLGDQPRPPRGLPGVSLATPHPGSPRGDRGPAPPRSADASGTTDLSRRPPCPAVSGVCLCGGKRKPEDPRVSPQKVPAADSERFSDFSFKRKEDVCRAPRAVRNQLGRFSWSCSLRQKGRAHLTPPGLPTRGGSGSREEREEVSGAGR